MPLRPLSLADMHLRITSADSLGRVSGRGHVVAALARPQFRRLFAVRLLGQFGDGIFQASLAGTVLFNPERQAHAADVAAAFAVLLLPYSFIGPFAGVLLDRWWRQRVFVLANIVRAACVVVVSIEIAAGLHGVPFYASALVVISISRFILSALSASLPHVVAEGELVTANALSTTVGSAITAAGGGIAIGVRALIGSDNSQYAVIAVGAALAYVPAAMVARGFARTDLGPDDIARGERETIRAVARGLAAGFRHVAHIAPVRHALSIIGLQRLVAGVTTVCTVLLYRNYLHADGLARTGLSGLTQAIAALTLGSGLAALVTPTAFRSIGPRRWVSAMLILGAATQLAIVLPYRTWLMLVAALLLGFVAQGIKISVDTQVQQHVADQFRGRVFSLYDVLVNVALVVAAALTALALPEDGRSPVSVLVLAAAYLSGAVFYFIAERPTTP